MQSRITAIARTQQCVPVVILAVMTLAETLAGNAAAAEAPVSVCERWAVTYDTQHPAWPGHLRKEPVACPKLPGRVGAIGSVVAAGAAPTPAKHSVALALNTDRSAWKAHAGKTLHLTAKNGSAVIDLEVTALQDGFAGDIIRLRSTLGPAVLLGQIQPDGSAKMVWKQDTAAGRMPPMGGAW